jgi:hypothetical protein
MLLCPLLRESQRWHDTCLSDGGGMPEVVTTKTLVLVGSAAALAAALVATSGLAGPRTTQLLLALGAMVALTLTRISGTRKP